MSSSFQATSLRLARTRPSSSRKVTPSTQCSAFSMSQCVRIARPRVAGSARQEVADLGLDLGCAVDAADSLDGQYAR